ncbi:hypothetical protein GCM10022295_93050 [Streptomyces osmaniensis]|uniref:Transposase n=1 Tax=Streptomyces osmaniensis TaxID=593134 RepID=A0ABP6Z7Q3_9ACTN
MFVLDALEMAIWQRDRDQHPIQPGELVHHSDAGAQYRASASPSTWTPPASRRASDPSVTRTTTP